MNIETKNLLLTEITIDDLQMIHSLHSIMEVAEYNTIPIPRNLDETRDLVQTFLTDQNRLPRSVYTWKIRQKSAMKEIGMAGMFLSNDKFRLGEIYYKFFPEYWGNGYATETSRALIKTGFEVLYLHKIEAGVATGNAASIRVLEKSGMIREGLRRKILPIRGQWKDNYHYGIVEDDERP